jgi:hypothetical protein
LLPLNLKSSLEILSDICVQQISNLTILDKENIPPQMTEKEEDLQFALFGPDSDQEDDQGPTKKKPPTQDNNDDDFDDEDEDEEIKPVPKRQKLAKKGDIVGTKTFYKDAEGEQQSIYVANDDDDDTLFSQTPSTVDPYDGYSETSNQTPSTISRRSYHNSDSDDDLFADSDDDANAATTTTHKQPKQSSVKSRTSRKQPSTSTSEQKSSAQLKPASASQSQVPTIKAAAQKISESILKHVPVPNYPLGTHPAQKSQHDEGEGEEEGELEDDEENEDESVYSHSQAGGGRQKGKTVNI